MIYVGSDSCHQCRRYYYKNNARYIQSDDSHATIRCGCSMNRLEVYRYIVQILELCERLFIPDNMRLLTIESDMYIRSRYEEPNNTVLCFRSRNGISERSFVCL